ncbi:MAG: hypothetical protein C7B43_21295 [Sulfobacillus benefaciens]|uniref:Uncharacterized protein n=1 Tax=Sulfobacillus benefaciens TaxID=453960 RepID=A0A2T2WGU8_9FIRM|nr:MAG: hypothetical protein C7B43_21295 [Sulfobacillus benefaciens]
MNILFIINDPPYGTERAYNALRHINAVAKHPETDVKVFFMADAVQCARQGQVVPQGYYNLERMITIALRHGVSAGACGTCMEARALSEEALIAGIHRSSMDELSQWTLWADKVIVY